MTRKNKSFDLAMREFAQLKKWTEDLSLRSFTARDNGTLDDHLEEYVDEYARLKADFHRLCDACGLEHD